MTYKEKIESLIQELRSNPKVNLTKVEITSPSRQTVIPESFPEDLKQFYREMGSIWIEWKDAEDEDEYAPPIGIINIYPLELATGYKKDEARDNCMVNALAVVDDITLPGCDDYFVFLDEDGYMHYYNEEDMNLKMSFQEYFDACIKGKGHRMLRYSIGADVSGNDWDTGYKDFVKDMARFFPQTDYASIFRFYKAKK